MSFDLNLETTLAADLGADFADTLGADAPLAAAAAPAAVAAIAGAAFTALGLPPEIVKAIIHAGYASPTDVQARAVPAEIGRAHV